LRGYGAMVTRLHRISSSPPLFEAFGGYGKGPYRTAAAKMQMTRVIVPPNSR